jgi:hypothetical protein
MTEPTESNTKSQLINMLFEYGLADGMPQIAQLLLNAAMIIQRSEHLGVDEYQRSDKRRGYANGFKPKFLHSSMGKLKLNIPQIRDCPNNSILHYLKKEQELSRLSKRQLQRSICKVSARGRSQK